jgi:hypothetical protein
MNAAELIDTLCDERLRALAGADVAFVRARFATRLRDFVDDCAGFVDVDVVDDDRRTLFSKVKAMASPDPAPPPGNHSCSAVKNTHQ